MANINISKEVVREDRDYFLSELVGECSHEFNNAVVLTSCPPQVICIKCGATQFVGTVQEKTDFSTWKGLGKLVEWVDKNWSTQLKREVLDKITSTVHAQHIPDAVANYVYNLRVGAGQKVPTFAKDQKVKVKDCEEHDWSLRHYSHYDPQSGRHYCFIEGRTSWTAKSGAAICWNIIENGEEKVEEKEKGTEEEVKQCEGIKEEKEETASKQVSEENRQKYKQYCLDRLYEDLTDYFMHYQFRLDFPEEPYRFENPTGMQKYLTDNPSLFKYQSGPVFNNKVRTLTRNVMQLVEKNL